MRLAVCLVASGRVAEARALRQRLDRPFDIAEFEAALGNRDAALAALRQAYDERDFRIATIAGQGTFADGFRSLRGDPEFDALVAAIGRGH